jgi:hypothetical protein
MMMIYCLIVDCRVNSSRLYFRSREQKRKEEVPPLLPPFPLLLCVRDSNGVAKGWNEKELLTGDEINK